MSDDGRASDDGALAALDEAKQHGAARCLFVIRCRECRQRRRGGLVARVYDTWIGLVLEGASASTERAGSPAGLGPAERAGKRSRPRGGPVVVALRQLGPSELIRTTCACRDHWLLVQQILDHGSIGGRQPVLELAYHRMPLGDYLPRRAGRYVGPRRVYERVVDGEVVERVVPVPGDYYTYEAAIIESGLRALDDKVAPRWRRAEDEAVQG